MAILKYKGKVADSDASLMSRGDIADRFASTAVNTANVDAEVAAQSTDLVTPTYVDNADVPKAKKTAVDSADALKILATLRGAANGVASLDASTKIPVAQLPALPDRLVQYATSPVTSSGSPWSATGGAASKVAQLTIPDPGYPYRILPFASMENRANTAGQSIGRIYAVRRSTGAKIGRGTSTTSSDWHRIKCTPCSNSGETAPAGFTGSDFVDFYVEKQSGGSLHIFTTFNFSYYALIIPVI